MKILKNILQIFLLVQKLFVNDGDKVENNQIFAEWDPYTLPIIAEKNGFVKYVDLKQGVSFRESIDDTTGISSKIVIDWSQNQKSKNFKPAINILIIYLNEKMMMKNFLTILCQLTQF